MRLDEADPDDEYDFMDEAGDRTGPREQQQRSKIKYMNILQGVADRTISHITIELDDLELVRASPIQSSK